MLRRKEVAGGCARHYPGNTDDISMVYFPYDWFKRGKGKGVMYPSNHSNGLSPDDVLKVIAWIRSQGGTAK